MPFALTAVGLLFVIVGFQNTYKEMGQQVQNDFTGQGNFVYWMIVIGVIGSIGYIKPLETFSRLLLALVLVTLFVGKGGAGLSALTNAVGQVTSGTTTAVNPIGADLSGGNNSTGTSNSDTMTQAIQAAKIAAIVAG